MTTLESQVKLLRIKDLALLLSVSTTTIWRWSQSGMLPPSISINNMVFWKETTIKDWIEQQGKGT
jgi:predicted DNA-binding transcriptional regulator AlpA